MLEADTARSSYDARPVPTVFGNPKLDRIGVQLFSIPRLLEKDFAGSMKMLAQLGYKEIEFYGPYPFSAAEDTDRWKAITPSLGFSGSGYFELTVQQVKKILDDNGLSSPSMHTGLFTLKNRMAEMAEAANVLGTKYVILPSAQTESNIDGYKRQADEFNEIGASAVKHGLRFAYHNHGNGLKEMEGKIPMVYSIMAKKMPPLEAGQAMKAERTRE